MELAVVDAQWCCPRHSHQISHARLPHASHLHDRLSIMLFSQQLGDNYLIMLHFNSQFWMHQKSISHTAFQIYYEYICEACHCIIAHTFNKTKPCLNNCNAVLNIPIAFLWISKIFQNYFTKPFQKNCDLQCNFMNLWKISPPFWKLNRATQKWHTTISIFSHDF